MITIKKHDIFFFLMIAIGLLLWINMAIYMLHEIWGYSIQWGILEYCLSALGESTMIHQFILIGLNIVIIYSLLTFFYILFKQVNLKKQWNKEVRFKSDILLTEAINRTFQQFNGKIIVIKDHSLFALTYGFVRPRIVISTKMLACFDQEEITAVLLHEYAHLKRFDPLRSLIINIIKDSFPFVPILKKMHYFIHVWMEIDADQYAMRHMGSPYALGSVLYKCASSNHQRLPIGVGFADDPINYRIQKLIEPSSHIKIPMMDIPPMVISFSVFITFAVIMLFNGCT